VRGLFNHSADLVLGRTKSGTMKLTADAKAL
jgi:phage head maturation protease